MQIVRTIIWILVTAILVAFVAMNWESVPMRFWPLDNGDYLLFEWPVGFIAIIFFLLGFIPSWLYYRGIRWRLNRRINALENSLRSVSGPSASISGAETATPNDEIPATTGSDS
ncbi:MAG: LapA family protein [Sphingomonadaceae bacterium]